MKKLFLSALIIAAAMTSCANKDAKTTEAAEAETAITENTVAPAAGEIVYVHVEAVLAQSDLFKQEGEPLQEKTKKTQESWAQKERNLQAEMAKLQEKYQKGLITTNDAQMQQEKLQKRAASYQSTSQKEAQKLDEENYVFTNRAQDLIARAIKEINSEKHYKMVVNAASLLEAEPSLDITNDVLKKVNELYASDKAAEKK